MRAVRGVDVTTEVTGLVRTLHFKSGDEVRGGQLLVELNADSEIAHSMRWKPRPTLLPPCMSATKSNMTRRRSARHSWTPMPRT